MTIDVSPEIEQRLNQRMATGRYGSPDELLQEAFDALDAKESVDHDSALCAIREGIADADAGRSMPADEAFKSIRQAHPYLNETCDTASS